MQADSYSFHFYIPQPGTKGYKTNSSWFLKKNWPSEIGKSLKNYKEVKHDLETYFNYPVNDYHTVTPHDHKETFVIINEKLKELEKLYDEQCKR